MYTKLLAISLLASSPVGIAAPVDPNQIKNEHGRIVEFWTPARRAAAKPRDFVIDSNGRAFIKVSETRMIPHGQGATKPLRGKPPKDGSTGGGGTDTGDGDTSASAPLISNLSPASGTVIGDSYTFVANVEDPDGIKSVNFEVTFPSGSSQLYSASATSNDNEYAIDFNGFTNGEWSWRVVAKDGAKRGGNTGTSTSETFTVEAETVVDEAAWPETRSMADVQQASGRILFVMEGSYYVCSGTVISDSATGRSLILTAAHCIYDDVNKIFATNVLFIPNQDQTTANSSDTDCTNDPIGCWTPKLAVVDAKWTTGTIPDNLDWDHGYYIVDDENSHSTGLNYVSDILDVAVPALPVSQSKPDLDSYTHALGYSYSFDPSFRYCAMSLSQINAIEGIEWWLDSCDLSGGSSGGPWVLPLDESTGRGPIISVNSWGYTTRSGMAGPRLDTEGASCLLSAARSDQLLYSDQDGEVVSCY